MKRKLSALILGAAALAVGFGSLAVAGVVAHKDAIVQTKAAETTQTIKFGTATGSTKIDKQEVTFNDDLGTSWDAVTVIADPSFTQQPSYSQIGASSKPATSFTLTGTLATAGVIKSVSVKFGGFKGTAGDIKVNVGSTDSYAIGSLNATNDVTVEKTLDVTVAANDKIVVSVTNISKGVKIYSLTYTYNDASSDPYIGLSSETADIGVTGTADITLSKENGLVVSQWAATSDKPSIASAAINGDVLTVTGVAAGSAKVTVAALNSSGNEIATATVTVTVNAYSIILSQKNATLGLQESKAITVTNNYAAANSAVVSASSNDTAIATVAKESDGTFTITGVSAGEAKVTFTGVDNAGQEASAYVKVTVKELSFKLSETPASLTLESGAHDIKITNPNNYGDSISYEASSSNVSVATVSVNEETVTITPVAKGTTTITVTGTGSNGSVASQSFDLEIIGEGEVGITSISSFRNETGDGLADGYNTTDTYKIQGVYIGKRFNSTYNSNDRYDLFIQQGDAAIMLYRIVESDFAGLEEGDLVTATGTVTFFRGTLEMVVSTLTIGEGGNTVTPLQITADNVATLGNDSRLVRCDNATFKSSSGSSDVSYVFTLSDGVTEVTVFDKGNTILADTTLTVGKAYNIEGIKGVYTYKGTTTHQIYVLSVEAVVTKDAADAAAAWATSFLDATYPCTTAASGAWSAQQTAFEALSSDAQNILIKATYTLVTYDDATDVQKAVWRYDLAVLRQGLNDFMNRKPVSGKDASLFAFDSKETQNTVLISTLGAAAVVAAAGFIFLKKKKA